MHFMPDSDTGHLSLMHTRLKALHDSMRRRGASEAAIARLPKLPKRVMPIDHGLPPIVLATKPHPRAPQTATGEPYTRQARSVNPVAEEYKRQLRESLGGFYKRLARRIVTTLVKSSGVSEYYLTGPGQEQFSARVRAIGMLAARDQGMTVAEAAAIFGRERTAVTHAKNSVPGWLEEDPFLRKINADLQAEMNAMQMREAA